MPGLGQAFESRWYEAAAFLFGTVFAYLMCMPVGVGVHLWSSIDAAAFTSRRRRAYALRLFVHK